MLRKIFLSLLLLVAINNNALTNTEAKNWGKFMGSVTGASYFLYKYLDSDCWDWCNNAERSIISTFSVLLGCTSYLLFKKCFSCYTPKAYLESVKEKIKTYESLINFINKDYYKSILIDDIKKMYPTSKFPLATAFHDFVKLFNNTLTIIEWLKHAKDDDTNQDFTYEINSLAAPFKGDYFERIQEIMLGLKADPNFMLEMQLSQSEENVRNLKEINKSAFTIALMNTLRSTSDFLCLMSL